MERHNGIPVEASQDSVRTKGGRLEKGLLFYPEFQPSLPRKFHLGIQQQPLFNTVGIDNPPEIEGFPG